MASPMTFYDTPGKYVKVAASQTDSVLGSAQNDYLLSILVVPATTSPGAVSIKDGSTSTTIFTGGASSVSNLVPFLIPLGLRSLNSGGCPARGDVQLSNAR